MFAQVYVWYSTAEVKVDEDRGDVEEPGDPGQYEVDE
jgi:hypothetical protein